MEADKKPYEILVRYDSDGNLKGAHGALTHIVTLYDGTVLKRQTLPEPVDIGAGKGFPVRGALVSDTLGTAGRIARLPWLKRHGTCSFLDRSKALHPASARRRH